MLNNMTALISCFARSYHTENSNIKIYDDSFARRILSDMEYKNISSSMTSGICFFNANNTFDGTFDDTLGYIVNKHLAPAVLARSSFNERHLNNEIRLGLSQYVILGAGYDTSGYKVNNKVMVFELDKSEMIEDKRERIIDAGINHDNVFYVGCDFNDEWINTLFLAGFDRNKKTLCSILGVSYYLEKNVFFETIKILADNISIGSAIIFDYPTIDDSYNNEKAALAAEANEAMKAKYSLEDILNICDKVNLKLYENLNNEDIDRDYFYNYNTMNPTNKINAPEGVSYCLLVK